jgi:hypothetical protein
MSVFAYEGCGSHSYLIFKHPEFSSNHQKFSRTFTISIKLIKGRFVLCLRGLRQSWLSDIQASRILIQPSEIFKNIYHFYKVIQRQICVVKMFTQHELVLPAATRGVTVVLPHTADITAEVSWICDHVTVHISKTFLSPVNLPCHMSCRKLPMQEWK